MGNCTTYCCNSLEAEDVLLNRSRPSSPHKRESLFQPTLSRAPHMFDVPLEENFGSDGVQAGQEIPRVPNRDIGSKSRFDNYFKAECTEAFSLEQHLDYIF